jgi:hypothetical protein
MAAGEAVLTASALANFLLAAPLAAALRRRPASVSIARRPPGSRTAPPFATLAAMPPRGGGGS